MRTKHEIEKALKEEIADMNHCNWHEPCASCFKASNTIHVLRWVLGKRKEILGVAKDKTEPN